MSSDSGQLECCARHLVLLGRKGKGYITYKTINEVTSKILGVPSMEAIDNIHQRLRAEQIEILDQLPNGLVVDAASIPLKKRYRPQRRHRTKVGYSKIEHWDTDHKKRGRRRDLLCPEKAIDMILSQWEEKGEPEEGFFANIIKNCDFSHREISELIAYLGKFGVDCPESYARDILIEKLIIGTSVLSEDKGARAPLRIIEY